MKTKPGQYSSLIALRAIISSLLLLLLLVTAVWSAGPAGGSTAKRSATQEKLLEIFKDPKYPELRKMYEEALRKQVGAKNFGDALIEKRRDPSDFVRFFNETKEKLEKPGLKLPEPRSESIYGKIMRFYRSHRSPVSEETLASQNHFELFAKSFFDYYRDDEGALSNALMINLRRQGRVYIDVYHRGSHERKTYIYNTADEMLSLFPKDVKELLAQSKATAVVSTGDSLWGHTHKELFGALGLPVIRTVSATPAQTPLIAPRAETLRKRFSEMTGENTVVLNGLPRDKEGLENLDKDVKNLKKWQDADTNVRNLLLEEKSMVLEANAKTFKEVLLKSDGKVVIYVVADTGREEIKFTDGSSITAKNIYRWEPRNADIANLPAVVFLACNTADMGPHKPGEIVQALLHMGYISGARPTSGFINPFRAAEVIRILLHPEKSAADKLPELEGDSVHRILPKTAERG